MGQGCMCYIAGRYYTIPIETLFKCQEMAIACNMYFCYFVAVAYSINQVTTLGIGK